MKYFGPFVNVVFLAAGIASMLLSFQFRPWLNKIWKKIIKILKTKDKEWSFMKFIFPGMTLAC